MSRLVPTIGILALGGMVLTDCVCVVERCSPSNCSGCCDAQDTCDRSGADNFCGVGGGACADCTSANEICVSGGCVSAFVGSYVTTESVNVTDTTGTTFTTTGYSSMTIDGSGSSLQVEMPSGGTSPCSVPATLTDAADFQIQSVTCQAFTDNNGCTDTFTYTSGSGNLNGSTLTIPAPGGQPTGGTYTQLCPGGATGSGTFQVSISGTHQ